MSAFDGSPTKTGWNRRSSAASFSICSRYSAGRAPIVRSSAASQRRLEHVLGVDARLRLRRADDRVQLVDEDYRARRHPSISPARLQPFLEFTTVLRACSSAPISSATTRSSFSPSGTSWRRSLRQAFDDRRLAHARLTDQDRVVLGPPLEHLDRAPDLRFAADDRIELAGARPARSDRRRTSPAIGTSPPDPGT